MKKHRKPQPQPLEETVESPVTQPAGYAEQRGPVHEEDGWGEANPAAGAGDAPDDTQGFAQGEESFGQHEGSQPGRSGLDGELSDDESLPVPLKSDQAKGKKNDARAPGATAGKPKRH